MKYYTDEEVRQILTDRVSGRKKGDVAKEIGVSQSSLSQALHGDPITGKIMDWLGFERGPRVLVTK